MRTAAQARSRANAPVARSVFWVMISLIAWEVFQGVRAERRRPDRLVVAHPVRPGASSSSCRPSAPSRSPGCSSCSPSPTGARSTSTRSSPARTPGCSGWAWPSGSSATASTPPRHSLCPSHARSARPGRVRGEDPLPGRPAGLPAAGVRLLPGHHRHHLPRPGRGPSAVRAERLLFVLGSLATYGAVLVYMGVGGGQIFAAIAASFVICAASFWILPRLRRSRTTPSGRSSSPGAVPAGLTLIVWTLVVGGQPTWPGWRRLRLEPLGYNRACLRRARRRGVVSELA